MSPAAYKLLRETRAAFAKAGPDGWLQHNFQKGEQMCVLARMSQIAIRTRAGVAAWLEVKTAWRGLTGKTMVRVNDEEGYWAVLLVLDILITTGPAA